MSHAGWSRTAWDIITLVRMALNLKLMIISGIFLLIFSDHGWPWVTEMKKSETTDNGGLLWFASAAHRTQRNILFTRLLVYYKRVLAWNKWNARYFFSKDGFTQDQQRTAIRGLQSWQITCKSPHSNGRRIHLERKKEFGKATVNKESMAFYWLSPCQKRRRVILPPVRLCYHHRAWELCLLVSQLYLIDVSIY